MAIQVDTKKSPAPDPKNDDDKRKDPPKVPPQVMQALEGAIRGGIKAGQENDKKDKPAEPDPTNNTFGPDQTRPKGDYRSAKDIIEDNKALKGLGDKPKEDLKKQLGDYEKDPDAAYRASQVIEHIEKFDDKGNEIKNRPGGGRGQGPEINSVGNNSIDGYFKGKGGKLEANPNTEAGRLQDFGKSGYGSLKGGDKGGDKQGDKAGGKGDDKKPPAPASSPSSSSSPPELPLADAVRPKGDNRSAQDIIDKNPTLKGLGNQENVKDGLKKQVGDFEHDADAAYRASQVIDYVTHVDDKGQAIKKSNGNDPTNDKIDGFFKDRDGVEKANNGTEAGRLKDFAKGGYDSLKGVDGKSMDELITHLNSNATADAVKAAGGDASKLGKDYFTGGKSDASGADKTAAMMKMSEALAKYKTGQEAYEQDKVNPSNYNGKGPSPGEKRDEFTKDVEAKIDQLGKDPDVQKFMNDKVPDALHAIVDKDPKLKAELQRRFDTASSPQALQKAFDKKDKDGKPASTSDALAAFINAPNFYGQALGVKPDLQQALKNAPKEIQDKVKDGYDGITSGKELEKLIAGGTPPDKAMLETGVNKAIFDAMLDEKTVKEGTEKFNESTTKYGREELLKGMKPEDLFKGLGVKGPDDPALQQLVEKNMDSLFPSTKDRPKAADIVTAVRAINDAMRQGISYDIAVQKVSEGMGNKLPKGTSDTFKTGVIHGASGILLAGALGAKSATGNLGSNTETAAQSIQAAALMTQGGAKFIGDQMNRANGRAPANETSVKWNKGAIAAVKDIENVGKSLGVVGNLVGLVAGSMSASQSAAKGDQVGAGFQGTFAALNGVAAVSGSIEVGAYVTGKFASAAASAQEARGLALLGSVSRGLVAGASVVEAAASMAGAVAGGIAAVGGLIYTVVSMVKAEKDKQKVVNKWYDEVSKDFADVGITPPSKEYTLAPPNADAYPTPVPTSQPH
jgi:hypothetical protein